MYSWTIFCGDDPNVYRFDQGLLPIDLNNKTQRGLSHLADENEPPADDNSTERLIANNEGNYSYIITFDNRLVWIS